MPTIRTTDGLRLAVQVHGDPTLPTVVCEHGWPDNHELWDGVVPLLLDRFRVVTYDARGAGASDKPRRSSAYKLEQLVADLHSVIQATSPEQPVHLLAHDWGSITAWTAIGDPTFEPLVRSLTSISGPSLDHAASWLRTVTEHPLPVLRQLASSYYIALFQAPVLPELLIRTGLLGRVVTWVSQVDHRGNTDELRHGLGMYRANFVRRLLFPKPQSTNVPVLVLAPNRDTAVTRDVQVQAAAPWAARLDVRDIEGNHWVAITDPQAVADELLRFVDSVD
jgi:pimeloyl-ACP methyl ester carboxylesterase